MRGRPTAVWVVAREPRFFGGIMLTKVPRPEIRPEIQEYLGDIVGIGYHINSCETLSFWSTYSIRAIGPLAIGPLLDIYGTRSRLLLHYASRMSEVCPK